MRLFAFFLCTLQLISFAFAKRNCIVIVDDFGPNNSQRVLLLDGNIICGGKTILTELNKQVYMKAYGYDQKDTGSDILHYFLSSRIEVYGTTRNIGKIPYLSRGRITRPTTLLDVNNGFKNSDSFHFSEVIKENMVPTWIPLEKFYESISEEHKAYFVPTEFWSPLWARTWGEIEIKPITETIKLPESIDYSFLSIKEANDGIRHLTKSFADFERGDIVFFDLDGTLLGGNSNNGKDCVLLWDGTLEFIQGLRDRGIFVIALTGRYHNPEHRWDHGLEFTRPEGINSAIISGKAKGTNMRNWIKENKLNPKRIAFADDVTIFLADVFLKVKKMKEESELPNLTKFVLVSSEVMPVPLNFESTVFWGSKLLQEYSPTESAPLVPIESVPAGQIASSSSSSSSLYSESESRKRLHPEDN